MQDLLQWAIDGVAADVTLYGRWVRSRTRLRAHDGRGRPLLARGRRPGSRECRKVLRELGTTARAGGVA